MFEVQKSLKEFSNLKMRFKNIFQKLDNLKLKT